MWHLLVYLNSTHPEGFIYLSLLSFNNSINGQLWNFQDLQTEVEMKMCFSFQVNWTCSWLESAQVARWLVSLGS